MFYPSVENLFDEMFNFDDDFFGREPEHHMLPARGGKHHERALMRTDVNEDDKAYELSIDLPGFDKKDIKVKLDNGLLTVSAEKVEEKTEKEDENGKASKHGKLIRKERYVGSMSRSWYVGEDIDRAEIAAKYHNGVLKLTVPKAKKEELPEDKKYIAIEG